MSPMLKIPLVLSGAIYTSIAMTPPNPPAKDSDIDKFGGRDPGTRIGRQVLALVKVNQELPPATILTVLTISSSLCIGWLYYVKWLSSLPPNTLLRYPRLCTRSWYLGLRRRFSMFA